GVGVASAVERQAGGDRATGMGSPDDRPDRARLALRGGTTGSSDTRGGIAVAVGALDAAIGGGWGRPGGGLRGAGTSGRIHPPLAPDCAAGTGCRGHGAHTTAGGKGAGTDTAVCAPSVWHGDSDLV